MFQMDMPITMTQWQGRNNSKALVLKLLNGAVEMKLHFCSISLYRHICPTPPFIYFFLKETRDICQNTNGTLIQIQRGHIYSTAMVCG